MSSQSLEQLSNLRPLTRLVTGHDQHGKSELHESSTFQWSHHDDAKMTFSVAYSTSSSPPVLTNDADLEAHKAAMARGMGLVNPRGSVLRFVDIAPGHVCAMHRTRSLDYGIVLEGEVELVLDDGVSKMRRGDVAVQRATMHQWRNASENEWARMVFVLQDCQAGVEEDLGDGGWLPPSGN
ncbi:hypothetical protein TOPH_01984 [Tolypocladium ophioglossoides CBS 100239]|uniref:Cupin type-2 domain-containing protein n=1 Tax=Tolypocladium ophioglossoides (strain CBS 100239) TaxID=1163406 RepID=A0A0L0NIH5_TOLOC|nr:hypothetical protein TOPH_01984 [Tolypocladium ophioglossoides CBS 100239]